jgi:hypothetical protein
MLDDELDAAIEQASSKTLQAEHAQAQLLRERARRRIRAAFPDAHLAKVIGDYEHHQVAITVHTLHDREGAVLFDSDLDSADELTLAEDDLSDAVSLEGEHDHYVLEVVTIRLEPCSHPATIPTATTGFALCPECGASIPKQQEER